MENKPEYNSISTSKIKSTRGQNGIIIKGDVKDFFYDPGYAKTASCKSSITYIDGDEGILSYRGYDILDITENKDYLSTVYLLLNGQFPDNKSETEFKKSIEKSDKLPEQIKHTIKSFCSSAHPMNILVAAFASLSSLKLKENYKTLLLRYTPLIIAYIYRKLTDKDEIAPEENLNYTENFLHMMLGVQNKENAKILDTILLLHADHEQNASTATARVVTSSGANPILAVSAATCTLSGSLHGGANEAAVNMLENIQKGEVKIEDFIQSVKDKKEKLMGFGHRVYKSYDPRAKVLGQIAKKVLKTETSGLFKIAKELEEIALKDEYFLSRKLYPNVDFYSGIILKSMGIPKVMFTPIFALARVSGWIAQIEEMKNDKEQKISRPRQIYIGENFRKIS